VNPILRILHQLCTDLSLEIQTESEIKFAYLVRLFIHIRHQQVLTSNDAQDFLEEHILLEGKAQFPIKTVWKFKRWIFVAPLQSRWDVAQGWPVTRRQFPTSAICVQDVHARGQCWMGAVDRIQESVLCGRRDRVRGCLVCRICPLHGMNN
jgi:hypothetical protein